MRLEEFGPHLAGAGVEIGDAVAVARHDEEIRPLPQGAAFAEGPHQGGEVLLLVGPGDGHDERAVRDLEETLDLRPDRLRERPPCPAARSGRYRRRAGCTRMRSGRVVVVGRILLLDFLAGAGEDQRGGIEAEFLGFDPGLAGCSAVSMRLRVGAAFEQALLLGAAERVAGEDERDSRAGWRAGGRRSRHRRSGRG